MVGRIAVVAISVVALILAMTPDSTVLGLVSYAWAGFGAAFGPAMILSLYWSRMNRNGALAVLLLVVSLSLFGNNYQAVCLICMKSYRESSSLRWQLLA